MKIPTRKRSLSHGDDDALSVPMLEIFAGAFALMLLLFVILNMFQTAGTPLMAGNVDEGEYKIKWDSKAEGFVVISYPSRLWIIEKQMSVKQDDLCHPDKEFIKYAIEKYTRQNKQLVFAVLDGGVRTTSLARNCLRKIFPGLPVSIGWIIADKALLKSINLQTIPSYVGDFAK